MDLNALYDQLVGKQGYQASDNGDGSTTFTTQTAKATPQDTPAAGTAGTAGAPIIQTPVQQPAPKLQASAGTSTNLSLPDSSAFLSSINQQMATIEKIQDPAERMKAVADFQGNVAAAQADILKQHMDVAEKQNNVPLLQQQLDYSRKLDRADTAYWSKYGTDSDETRAVNSELEMANSKAQVEAARTLKTDATLAAAMTKIDIFTKNQERLIGTDENKANQADMLLGNLNVNSTDWTARLVSKDIATDPTKLKIATIALTQAKGQQGVEARELFDSNNTEEDLPILAAKGNGLASTLTSQLQAQRTQQPIKYVADQVRAMQTAAINPDAFNVLLKQFPTLLDKQGLKDYTQKALSANSNSEKKDLIAYRAKIVQKLPSVWNTARLEGNIDNWINLPGQTVDPDMAQAVTTLKSTNAGQPVTIDQLAKQYVQSAPKEQQADRLAKLQNVYGKAIEANNAGLYGQVDKAGMMLRLQARSAIFASLDHAMQNMGEGINLANENGVPYVAY